ncbi:hypothetical protein PSYAC_19713 [Pseudomonas syringae pv. actinidiae str. M302091]|nr:hypothetical protein PSYAC_19713 [Pseudomonas syringae pv. actinidiae str. M302091]EPM82768.1 hypothetical protein A260_27186 [Pseudomonas syringae pv. actinidiae ICMP 19068]EPM91122.1 hypothetical protein A259_39346 [Pseudomonas syringae pv. actinidiae ICMP 19070]EPM92564.1 hypothetical protein A258_27500 [Pseudomonas syringae pv. actinidiae ICMP 19104]EPN07572.1 hypothetical protein A252_26379 [Pseudomonas syringae pv. actinidiae ICMP 9855]KCU94922.1 hypothetical protein A250_26968 [Pseud
MLAARLGALPIVSPCFRRHLQLRGHQAQQWLEWFFIHSKCYPGIAHVTELYSEAQPICRPTPLADDGEVGFAERVVTNHFILGIWQRQ